MEEIGEALLLEVQKPVASQMEKADHNLAVGKLVMLHQIARLPEQLARNAQGDLDEIAKHTPKLMENEDVEVRPNSAAP